MQGAAGLAVIAEAHSFYSAGLADLLGRKLGVRSVAASTLEQTIQALARSDAAILLTIDSSLLGMRGVQTVRMLRDRFPTTPMLLTASQMDRETLFQLIAAGAHGVVPKSADSADVLVALRTVIAGQIFVPTSVREQPSVHSVSASIRDQSGMSLTPRQSEVVALMCEGKSNKAIARELGISPSTVKVHLHAAFRSLGVHSRVGAASASFERQHSSAALEMG
jgi:DNA-binding NarL/FixJ family response regulator